MKQVEKPSTILLFYIQTRFWSMGEGKGTPSFVRTLTWLAERGHSVHVFLPSHDEGDEIREDTFSGVHLHHVPAPGRLIPRAALPLPKRLHERLRTWIRYQSWGRKYGELLARELQPDLLISLGAFEAPAARAVGEALGIPNVIRLYGSWLPMEKSVRYYLNFPAICALRTPAVAHLITDDGSQGDRIALRAGVPEDRLFFPRNGIDLARFSPDGPPGERDELRTRLGIGREAPVLISATRLSVEKKLHRVMAVVPDLVRQLPDFVFLLVGDGEERERLEKQVEELAVGPHVRFVGAVANDDVPSYLRAADLLVSLLDRTNTNNPVLEAMAAGLPIFALQTGATHEVIEPGVSGWILGPDELPELATHLAARLGDRGSLCRAGEAARRRITRLVKSPEERLGFEVALYEAAATGRPLPRWEMPR